VHFIVARRGIEPLLPA